MGLLRLIRRALAPMPLHIAVLSLVAGAGVLALAGVLSVAQLDEPSEAGDSPRLPLDPHAGAHPEGVLEGTGVFGRVLSNEGDPLGDVEVFLLPLFEEGTEAGARTSEDGTFEFADVSPDPGSPYVVEAAFEGARFPSEVLRTPRTEVNPVRITVAPTTTDDAGLAVALESITLLGDESGLQALHVLSLENLGEEAFTGPLALPLLPGATAIDPGAGLDRRSLDVVGGSLVSGAPILPGPLDITYTYVVPMQRQGIPIDRRLVLETIRFELLVGGRLVLDDVEGLESAEHVSLGAPGEEQTYQSWRARGLVPGDRLAARVNLSAERNILVPALAGLALLLVLLVVLRPLLRRRRPGETAAETKAPEPTESQAP